VTINSTFDLADRNISHFHHQHLLGPYTVPLMASLLIVDGRLQSVERSTRVV